MIGLRFHRAMTIGPFDLLCGEHAPRGIENSHPSWEYPTALKAFPHTDAGTSVEPNLPHPF
jgi:hypothetical protein